MSEPSEAPAPEDPQAATTLAAELAAEQAYVDLVYAELAKASRRARLVAAEGHARARSERSGSVREEELTGLFERDALVFHAARRQHALDSQYEGLVFGRLDLQHPAAEATEAPIGGSARLLQAGSHEGGVGVAADDGGREVRYIGRLGVRDEEYEPLVIDWRAPAASPFYRATPVAPLDVVRRRVLRCRGDRVIGVEDDLMVPEAPADLVVIGDGALMAALTRSRGPRMRDIVATIQRHQDEAIRSPGRGVTEITGGPGTGKTVVALHRAAYLLYSDRRRYEAGGILVVGPSAAYTAYIERVLPSLGEESVTLRSTGDLVDVVSAQRFDPPPAAAVKGSLRMREVLSRAARDLVPGAPTEFRAFVAGEAVRLDETALEQIRASVTRQHQRNLATDAVVAALGEAAFRASHHPERADFLERFVDHLDVESFIAGWWPQVDPREVLLWLADRDRLARYADGLLTDTEVDLLADSMQTALRTGTWSVADVALIDELTTRTGLVRPPVQEERGFFEIEHLDELDELDDDEASSGLPDGIPDGDAWGEHPAYSTVPHDVRERLLQGRIGRVAEFAHILVDEAQDLSPMQWRMLGRRGRSASWTVVGDATQSLWPGPDESAAARSEAWGGQEHRVFHMNTNYRNAREIFDYAASVIREQVPDADLPEAVRVTGVAPMDVDLGPDVLESVLAAVHRALGDVEGSVAVITPQRYAGALAPLERLGDGRVRVVDALSTKGLEYDATAVVDPDGIVRESAGGIRTLYVALTRAAHRMTVLRRA
ncbi:MAG: HelD family protein [Dermatophilaceae bacterium]